MVKKAIAAGLCVVFLSVAVTVFAEDVYRTENGKKYHKEDCRLIQNRNTQKIDKEGAVKEGLEPCGRCFKQETSSAVSKDTKQVASSKKSKNSAK
ncbi:MAG TPA: hypothetical protein PL155_09250 [Candidatus Omnitrophota bacterium]|nr:hypothetical protein [Candidatus Omnitrophota bacterium]HPD85639.1 hypothetical protein [Candidatus Omnitrophota bacterium]HRZ04482.1 hypothetical protein [Candidatus Omnitrophota bacterium]